METGSNNYLRWCYIFIYTYIHVLLVYAFWIGWSPGGVRLVVHQIMEGKMCSEGAKLSEKNLSRAGVCLVNMTTARRKNPGQPVQC